MARTSQRSNTERFKYGICLNDECSKCKGKEIQQIPMRKDFVCEECGSELRECPPPKKSNNKLLIIIVSAVVVIVGIVLVLLLGGKSEPLTLTLNKSQMEITVGCADTLVVTVLPEDAEFTLLFQSSNENVATVNSTGIVTAITDGEATITTTVQPKKGDPVTTTCLCIIIPQNSEEDVDIKEEDDSSGNTDGIKVGDNMAGAKNLKIKKQELTSSVSSGKLSLSYGNYSGSIKKGYAHGQGRLVYTTNRVINRNDPKKRTANTGDYVIGEFYNGFVVYGKHYDSAGNLLESLTFGVGSEDSFESK